MPRPPAHAAALLLLALLWPAYAAAQERVKPSAEQLDLMDRGARANKRGDLSEAERLYRQTLGLGSLNVAWLNLGRVLQKRGACFEARDAFTHALSAPKVASPEPAQIRDAVDRYLDELLQSCPGRVTLSCSAPNLSLWLDGQPAACDSTVELPPGTYEIRVRARDRERLTPVTVEAMQTLSLTLHPPAPSNASPDLEDPEDPEAPRPPSDLKTGQVVGWGLVGLGGIGLASGFVFSGLVAANNIDVGRLGDQDQIPDAQADQLIRKGIVYNVLQIVSDGLGGAGLISGGLVLWSPHEDPDAPPATLTLTPDGLLWMGSW